VVDEEMQEFLLVQEEELTQREEALASREEKARISEKALAMVSADRTLNGPRLRLLEKSTSTRWRLTLPVPSTHLALIRCWGRRRLSSTGESDT
jgi:hypothetical protein